MCKRYERDYAISRHHTDIDKELRAAIEKFPAWPDDMLHALTIISEEHGELCKAVLQYHYEPNKNVSLDDIKKEAVQTICMLHRFLNSLETSRYTVPEKLSTSQHEYSM